MGALIIGQAITTQNMQGMHNDHYIDQEATSDFWSNAISGLYNSITNTVGPWYRNTRPIKTATEKAIQLATTPTGKLAISAGIGAYTLYNSPWWILYPTLTTGALAGATMVPGLSHFVSEIGDGANINHVAVQNVANKAIAVGKTIVSPQTVKGIVTSGYETGKAAVRTVKDDLLNVIKDEISNDIRASLNIPDDQDVNFDTVSDKLTGKFKNELEQSYRKTLNIPIDQPVNIETITKKVVEEPVRKIFNIAPEEEVTADAVMYNIAKNTVYRFGIPTAALIAATPIAITAGYFGCKYAYHRLTTEPEPPIFIESSEKSRWQSIKDFVLRRTDIIPELAYSEELEKTFDLITRSSINAFHEIQDGKKNIFYEPVLMYGPPGTGKTAKAKQMIKQIYQATGGQMQWRITNGSMLLNAGQHGINKMFDWLNKQPAACLFIDEADTLFPDRDEMEKYPERLEIVNHLLSLIGERSNKFMIIMTTNRLGAFDDAMARRIDNLIHIPLPNEQGRNRVLKLYRDTMLANQQSSWTMKLAEKYRPQLFEKSTLIRK